MAVENGGHKHVPLFETRRAKAIGIYRVFSASVFVGICLIWAYRVTTLHEGIRQRSSPQKSQNQNGSWVRIGLFAAELWFGFYWLLSQSVRWNPVYRSTFKDRLSKRYENDELPGVDIFVCTADPVIEPPIVVINTVLSVMTYNYPPEKLTVYVSDDAGCNLTFHALLEAAAFAKHWIPYCKKFNVEARAPAAYFGSIPDEANDQFIAIKKLYKDMENRLETAAKNGCLSDAILLQHQGFSKWDSNSSRTDHDTILQVVVDGKNPLARDEDGCALPTLVYLAREKRPGHPHNFKAGALNALIRVSSNISNGQIIHNLDCDMFSTSSDSVRDAICFFMDEGSGNQIGFVQFRQSCVGLSKNDIYSSALPVYYDVESHGMDGNGGAIEIGSGWFYRRDSLCGRRFSREYRMEVRSDEGNNREESSLCELEEQSKALAGCTYEENTGWGKDMGVIYGTLSECIITGLSVHCRGWKSVHFNPTRKAFFGLPPNTLGQKLVQQKRWSEGNFQVMFTKYSLIAWSNIGLAQIMGYCYNNLWAPSCLPVLYYTIVHSVYLLRGISLFPACWSLWFIPFAYVIFSQYIYSLAEFLWCGGTFLGWWNCQRMWLYERTTSHLFGFIDVVLKYLQGFRESPFVVTAKVSDQDVTERYLKERMEFGAGYESMFTVLATIALINLFCLIGSLKDIAMKQGYNLAEFFWQILLCFSVVAMNLPLYEGLFLRRDSGKMPSSVTVKSLVLALSFCTSFRLL